MLQHYITVPEARAVHAGSTPATLAAQAVAELGDLSRLEPGRFYHFRATGDADHKHGWAVRRGSRVTLGSFKAAARERVVLDVQPPSPDQLRLQHRGLRAQHQATEARHEQAATRAAAIWARSVDLDDGFPYLQRKRVWSNGARIRRNPFVPTGGQLVVPLRDRALGGKLWTVELIDADGVKKFLPGGRTAGCFFTIAESWVDTDPWLVCEGYATGAALAMATGLPVCCAMSCGNLKPVCLQVRAELPRAPVIVCADNDTQTDGNPGVTHARQAAVAVGGRVVLPTAPFNDFNDQWVATGRISL